jgi:hypothetical protein
MIKYTLAVGFAIFIVLFLFYSPFTRYSFLGSPPEQRSSCGKFDGEVFDFPAPYVFLSPEYEGLSIWEQGYKKNKRGCDANFTVVALKVQWPSLLPAEKMWVGANRPPGQMGITLEQKVIDTARDRQFDEVLGLYKLIGVMRPMQDDKIDVYWREVNGYTDVLLICRYYPDGRDFDCNQTWLANQGRLLIVANYTRPYFTEWQAIMLQTHEMLKLFKRN